MATLKIVNHADLEVSYKVLNADCVHASHLSCNGFQKNPDYPFENERRYHAEKISQEKVVKIACQLDPAHLLDMTCVAASGMPIVDKNGNVLGGNGRSMAIQYAYSKNYKGAALYASKVEDFCKEYGIECNVQNPILVREINAELPKKELQSLISALNDNYTHARSKVADAYSRGSRFTSKTLKSLACGLAESNSLKDFFDDPSSVAIIPMLLKDGVILETEANSYINGGYLNPDGKTLVESSLRSIVAEKLEVIARIPSPIIGKLDAILPYVLIAKNIHANWDVTPELKDALNLLYEYQISGEKKVYVFLRLYDMTKNGRPLDRYSKGAISFFHMFRENKKLEIVNKFKKFASDADLSIENNAIPMIAKNHAETIQNLFGFTKETASAMPVIEDAAMEIQEIENINNTPVVENRIESANSNNPVKTTSKRGKNDCTKDNSTFIVAVNSQKEDMTGIIAKTCESLGVANIELTANSKTQYKINGFDGYRIIRSGRQWQLRLMNDYIETASEDVATDMKEIDAPESITDSSNNDNNTMEIDGHIFNKRFERKIKKTSSVYNYNYKGAMAYAAYMGNRVIYNYMNSSYYYVFTPKECNNIMWAEVDKVWYVDANFNLYALIINKKEYGARQVMAEVYKQLENLNKGYNEIMENTNNKPKETDILDNVKVHFTPKEYCSIIPTNDIIVFNAPRPLMGKETKMDNFIMGNFWASCNKEDYASIKNNIDMDATIIMAYTPPFELVNIILASNLISQNKKDYYKNLYETGKLTKEKYYKAILRHYKDITYKEYKEIEKIMDNIKDEIQATLENLNWQEGKLNVKGGTQGGVLNPDGNRIVTYYFDNNILRANYGWDTIAEVEFNNNSNAIAIAKQFTDAVWEWALNTGNYDLPEAHKILTRDIDFTAIENLDWDYAKNLADKAEDMGITGIYSFFSYCREVLNRLPYSDYKDGYVINRTQEAKDNLIKAIAETPDNYNSYINHIEKLIEEKQKAYNNYIAMPEYVYCEKIEDSKNITKYEIGDKKQYVSYPIDYKYTIKSPSNDFLEKLYNLDIKGKWELLHKEAIEYADANWIKEYKPQTNKEIDARRAINNNGIVYFELSPRRGYYVAKFIIDGNARNNNQEISQDKEAKTMPVNDAQNNKGKCSNKTIITNTSIQGQIAYKEYKKDMDAMQFDIFEHLLGMGYESNECLSHTISITVKGGFKGQTNKEGLRRVHITRHKEYLCASYGENIIYKMHLYIQGTAQELAQELHNAIMEWDKKTGDYTQDKSAKIIEFTNAKKTPDIKAKSIGIQHEFTGIEDKNNRKYFRVNPKTSGQLSLL